MKKRRSAFLITSVSAVLFAVLLNCANPVDDPLKWRSKVEIPVTNASFIIGEEFDNLFSFDSMDILRVLKTYYYDPTALVPDTVKGDTVIFSILKADTSHFESHEDAFEDKIFHAQIGPIPISGASDLSNTLPIPPVAGAFSVPVTIDIDSVYQITFYDTTTNLLQITLTNSSSSAVDDIEVAIGGLGTASAGTIAAGETRVLQIDVAGNTMYDTAVVTLSGTTDGSAGKSLDISMSINGLLASSVSINDHLVNYSQEFVNPYRLTDTVSIDYIDIEEGFFHYSIINHTGIELLVLGVHEHLWMTSFSEENGYSNYKELSDISSLDSMSYFLGRITTTEMVAPPQNERIFSTENLSACRLFPEWDSTKEETVTNVKYMVTTRTPRGDTINLSASDSIVFTIKTTSFKFREFLGTVMKPYYKTGDTNKVSINLPWDASVKDSLRGKFILQEVFTDVKINAGMPNRAFIDSMFIDFSVFSPESSQVMDTASTSFVHVKPDTSFLRSIDITNVTNLYPDTVAIAARMRIPLGTKMRVVNDLAIGDEDFKKYIGRMIIHIATSYRLNAKLDWEVAGDVNMSLGSGRFEVMEPLRFVRKLDDRRASFNMFVSNNSNLNMLLYALVAPQHLIDSLDSMPANDIYDLIINPGKAEDQGYVNLLGSNGIRIPPRNPDSTIFNSIDLNNEQLETILMSDTCSWRWWLKFLEQDRDAMSDTDYIKINSWLHVEGINNTDSLVNW